VHSENAIQFDVHIGGDGHHVVEEQQE